MFKTRSLLSLISVVGFAFPIFAQGPSEIPSGSTYYQNLNQGLELGTKNPNSPIDNPPATGTVPLDASNPNPPSDLDNSDVDNSDTEPEFSDIDNSDAHY